MNKRLSIFTLAILTIGMLVSCSKVTERISELEGRIDGLESGKIVSIEKQIADITSSISDLGKIREDILLLTRTASSGGQEIAELEVADALISDRISSLQAYLDRELKNYAEKEIVAATYATLAQHDATNAALGALDARFGTLDTKLSNDIKAAKESLSEARAKLEQAVAALTGRLDALSQRIQAVTIVPAGGDGSVKAVNEILTVNCIVKPSNAVKNLTKDNFTLLLCESLTKSASLRSIGITDDQYFSKDTLGGTVTVKADLSAYVPAEGKTLTVALNVHNSISDFTTDFAMARFTVVTYQYIEAHYSTEGGPHWEFVIREDESSPYPTITIKTTTAYSDEFLEGNFDVESVVVAESETERTEYTGGDINVTCSSSGEKYDITGTVVSEDGEEFSFDTPEVTAEAVDDRTGEPIELKDKDESDPTRKDVEEVTFTTGENPQVEVGRSTQLGVRISPADATNKNVIWSSSNPAVATVTQDGTVTGIGVGTAEITVTTIDGRKAASCTVTILPTSVTGVSLDTTNVRMLAGETVQLVATVTPEDAANKNLIWTSSNPAAATVSTTGLISGVEKGTTTITVTTEDGGFTATCTVKVYPGGLLFGEFSVGPDKKVRFSKGNLRYTVGTGVWSFFDNQYDCGPNTYAGGHNVEISLFTWGYSATQSIIPDLFSISNVSSSYEGNLKPEHDWGRVMGDGSTWRTLTIEEWKYLIGNPEGTNCREDAWEKFGFAKVCGVMGLIIRPDTFEKPDVTPTASGYSAEDWRLMEAAGAVFLPSAGYRRYDEDETPSIIIDDYGRAFRYWSSSPINSFRAYASYIQNLTGGVQFSAFGMSRGNGLPVRLVTEIN